MLCAVGGVLCAVGGVLCTHLATELVDDIHDLLQLELAVLVHVPAGEEVGSEALQQVDEDAEARARQKGEDAPGRAREGGRVRGGS